MNWILSVFMWTDPFVKVYLLQDGRKISKKKTSIKRDDTNPIYNEAMIFSVPAIVLQVTTLSIHPSVCGYIYLVFHVCVLSVCLSSVFVRFVGVFQDLSLRVTVAESTEDGRGENVGHVIIGPEAGGMGITHWNQMLATLRKPVSMWHPLRRT